jgi:CBS domain containing-hemolysin-like protein
LSNVAVLTGAPATAHAALISGETLDKAADVIAIFAIVLVPAVLIALFLYVHILPEKIAEQRQHPQKAAIKALCLMSLAFGGLLWPLAWLWAYSRPVAYKLAYGTEKHEDYFKEAGEQAEKGIIAPALLDEVRLELDGLAARGQLTPELRDIRNRLASLQNELAAQLPASPGDKPKGGTV